jgi:hypothetical protein
MRVIVDRLSKTYRDRSGHEVAALEDIALKVEPEEFVAVLGPSGTEGARRAFYRHDGARGVRGQVPPDALVDPERFPEAHDSAQGYCGHVVRGGGRQGRPREVNPSRKEFTMRMRPLVLAGVLSSLVLAGPAAALEVGQKAPDFTLAGVGGKQIKLADMLGKGPIVLYTFIQAFTGP